MQRTILHCDMNNFYASVECMLDRSLRGHPDVLAVRDEYRAQMWTRLIQECKASGMTNKDFCMQRGISEKIFYYWQRKFREQVGEAASPQLVQLEAVSASTELLQISFRGAELKLPAQVDIDAVAALLRSVQSL